MRSYHHSFPFSVSTEQHGHLQPTEELSGQALVHTAVPHLCTRQTHEGLLNQNQTLHHILMLYM